MGDFELEEYLSYSVIVCFVCLFLQYVNFIEIQMTEESVTFVLLGDRLPLGTFFIIEPNKKAEIWHAYVRLKFRMGLFYGSF